MLLDFLRTMFLRSCSLESLFVQTNWKTFFVFSVFALHQTFSSTCRIKVMTFVSRLLTAWKIIWKYHLGIANTEISKPGDKSSTLLSTGIQFLIWPAAVSLDLFKIFSWLVIPCTTFCQIKWRQQCLDFLFFFGWTFYLTQNHILLLFFPHRFLTTSYFLSNFSKKEYICE